MGIKMIEHWKNKTTSARSCLNRNQVYPIEGKSRLDNNVSSETDQWARFEPQTRNYCATEIKWKNKQSSSFLFALKEMQLII